MADPATRSMPLRSPRRGHTATLLDDGRVVLAGGAKPVTPERAQACDFDDPCSLASAEIVDPDALSSTPVTPMRVPREAHTAAPVPGGVLVCGGLFSGGGCVRTPGVVERFDVASDTWSDVAPVPGTLAPSGTPLDSGKFLLVGGLGVEDAWGGALLWDPADTAWHARTGPARGRYLHAAQLLGDGRVLIAGGLGHAPDGKLTALASAAIYDPRADTWTEVAPLRQARAELTLTALEDGSVLAAGGYGDDPAMLASAELFRPETGAWTEVGSLRRARAGHTATALPDGRALVVGGTGGTVDAPLPPFGEAELFDPRSGTFDIVASLSPRAGHTATRLADGRILVAGGGPETAEIIRS